MIELTLQKKHSSFRDEMQGLKQRDPVGRLLKSSRQEKRWCEPGHKW